MLLQWKNISYPTNMTLLIWDCRSLKDQDWVVQVQHIYREANKYVDVLAKRETHQWTFWLYIAIVPVLYM